MGKIAHFPLTLVRICVTSLVYSLPMSESQQLQRQWKLLQQLAESRTGIPLRELAGLLQVTDRTLRRDLSVLQAVGFPLQEITEERGLKRWKMRPFSDQLSFHYIDLISIMMSRRFMEPLAGTPFWEGHQRVLRKIRGALGEQALNYCEKLSVMLRVSGFGISNYSQRGAILDALMQSMEEGRQINLTYQSARTPVAKTQDVVPRGLVWHNGSLYLVAWSLQRQAHRTYKVDRMEHAELGAVTGEGQDVDFSLEEWQRQAFGIFQGEGQTVTNIRIRFDRDAARYVQESWWHDSQQFTPCPDGSVEMSLMLNDFSAVSKWVRGFGPGAQILSPPEFVERFRNDLKIMLNMYTDDE